MRVIYPCPGISYVDDGHRKFIEEHIYDPSKTGKPKCIKDTSGGRTVYTSIK